MFAKTRIEVLSLVAHFILAALLIAAYVVLKIKGVDDQTMTYCLISGVTFFFGAAANGIIASKTPTKPTDPPKDNTHPGGPGI